MCGIFFSLGRDEHVLPDDNTEQLLKNRGPDSKGTQRKTITTEQDSELYATFISTVLSLRGASIVEQPLRDTASQSVLCWNGEAWAIGDRAIDGNDSQRVFDALLDVCRETSLERSYSTQKVVNLLSSVKGPFAFTFYDAANGYIYYGRDCLGRRSLLRKSTHNNTLVLSSICDNATGEQWSEVEADGLYVVDVKSPSLDITHIPHRLKKDETTALLSFPLPFPTINRTLNDSSHPTAEHLQTLSASLRRSLQFRIQHVRESVELDAEPSLQKSAKIAILFSGGLDCTILARLSHDLLPVTESIDLLNVAFENPRIHAKLENHVSPYELCPDRLTGRASYAELVKVCPDRHWRFVEINVPYTETVAHRNKVMALMHPHNTEMDLSISYALYFASRGTGLANVDHESVSQKYTTPAHVLLSGLGADELFGGYQRHATAFTRRGYPGLLDELQLDFSRLGKRNLGRDDRVISDSGREVRFPFLDEDFIALALELPVWAKCDFENVQQGDSDNPARFLEPGKRILRMLAWQLDMKNVAAEKKRAIQFGARTAKMETGKTKGTQVLT